VVSSDLDEFAIAALRAEPVDSYGVGTSVVTGSGAPTASMVYKLVEVDGLPVEKRSAHKESHGGRKKATRLAKPSGTIVEEIVHPAADFCAGGIDELIEHRQDEAAIVAHPDLHGAHLAGHADYLVLNVSSPNTPYTSVSSKPTLPLSKRGR
jgi:hypothetical protein